MRALRPRPRSPRDCPSTYIWTDSSGREAQQRQVQATGGGTVVELVVEIDRRVDQAEVAEGLGEVSQLLSGRADLLPEQADVVAVGQHLLERHPGLLQPAGPSQRVDVPEGAHREGAFAALQSVG